jgi:hypothetical protein
LAAPEGSSANFLDGPAQPCCFAPGKQRCLHRFFSGQFITTSACAPHRTAQHRRGERLA